MPRKRARPKTLVKRHVKRRKSTIPRTVYAAASTKNMIPTQGKSSSSSRGPLAVQQKAVFNYCEPGQVLNPGLGGSLASKVFTCNGLYDPDVSGTGHQPRGFDQMMALYDHYVVTKCKMTVMYWNSDETNGQMIHLCVRDLAAPTTTTQNILEKRYVKSAMIGPTGS